MSASEAIAKAKEALGEYGELSAIEIDEKNADGLTHGIIALLDISLMANDQKLEILARVTAHFVVESMRDKLGSAN